MTSKVEFDFLARDQTGPVFDKFGRRVRDTARDVDLLGGATKRLVGAAAGYIAFDTAADFLRDATNEAREAAKVNALTENVIRTTGGSAKVTAKEVASLAGAISNKTAIDDEAVQTGANLLLTFKNIRNEAGEGNKVFDRTTAAAVDLAASGFGDINSAAKMLGKSLNDPIKGVSALGKAGVTFSEDQKRMIRSLVETGDLLGAQKIILQEVESQVGGSAAAQADGMDRMKVAVDNAKEAIGTALLPAINEFGDLVADKSLPAAERFSDWLTAEGIPGFKEFVEEVRPLAQDALPILNDGLGITRDILREVAPLLQGALAGFNALPAGAQSAILAGAGTAYLASSAASLIPGRGSGAAGGKGGAGGGSTPILGFNLPTLLGAGAAVQGGQTVGGVKEYFRNRGDQSGGLASTLTRDGKSTAETIAAVQKELEKSAAGKHAQRFGIDLQRLATELANTGAEGEYVKETLGTLGREADDWKDGVETIFNPFETGGQKAQSARSAIKDLMGELDEAGGKAKESTRRQQDLAFGLGLSTDAAGNLTGELRVLGDQAPNPVATLSDQVTGPAGVVLERLLSIGSMAPAPRANLVDLVSPTLGNIVRELTSLDGRVATVTINEQVNRYFSAGGIGDIALRGIGRADGGPIRGAGGPREDAIPIWASNGEHMVAEVEVRGAGGHAAVEAQRAEWRRAAGRADGGAIGAAAGAAPTPFPRELDLSSRSIRELGDYLLSAINGGARSAIADRVRAGEGARASKPVSW